MARVKLATWNVNSLRAREDLVLDWLEVNRPDVLCLQETKLTDQEFPEDAFGDLNYDAVYWGQRAYNGVAIVSRPEMKNVRRGFAGDGPDAERRLIRATIAGIEVLSVYVPNGQAVGSAKFKEKLAFYERLRGLLLELKDRPTIVLGDYNCAPADEDVFDPVALAGQLLASDEERQAFFRLLDAGYVDALRALEPSGRRFTWWDYRAGGWERNLGLRIDHALCSRPLAARLKAVTIHEEIRGRPQPSDHVPLVVEIEEA